MPSGSKSASSANCAADIPVACVITAERMWAPASEGEQPSADGVARRARGEDRGDPVRRGLIACPDAQREPGGVRQHRLQRDGGRASGASVPA